MLAVLQMSSFSNSRRLIWNWKGWVWSLSKTWLSWEPKSPHQGRASSYLEMAVRALKIFLSCYHRYFAYKCFWWQLSLWLLVSLWSCCKAFHVLTGSQAAHLQVRLLCVYGQKLLTRGMALVGRDLKVHLVQHPAIDRAASHQIRLPRAPSNLAFLSHSPLYYDNLTV